MLFECGDSVVEVGGEEVFGVGFLVRFGEFGDDGGGGGLFEEG